MGISREIGIVNIWHNTLLSDYPSVVTYAGILRSTYGASAVFPLVNATGGAVPEFVNGWNGTYSNVTPQDAAGPVPSTLAPTFNGTTSYMDIFTAGLAGAFNPAALSVFIFVKLPSGAWTDATIRYLFDIQVNNGNRVYMRKNGTNNQIRVQYGAGGTFKTVDSTALGGLTSWLGMGATVDTVADELKFYGNGSQLGSTQTALGTWVGTIATALIGSQPAPPSAVFSGQEAYMALKFGLPVWTATDFTNMQNDAATAIGD